MSWDPVYRFVKKIPRGRVTTYGAVARALRLPGGARAVGFAMAATPRGRGIPWHRVVGEGGRIRVPEPYASLQRKLLVTEGVALDGGVIEMSRFAWHAKSSRAPKKPAKSRVKPSSRKRAKSRSPRRS